MFQNMHVFGFTCLHNVLPVYLSAPLWLKTASSESSEMNNEEQPRVEAEPSIEWAYTENQSEGGD